MSFLRNIRFWFNSRKYSVVLRLLQTNTYKHVRYLLESIFFTNE